MILGVTSKLSRVLLRSVSKAFITLLIFSQPLYSAGDDLYDMDISFKEAPLFYNQSLYGFNTNGLFVKATVTGQEVWKGNYNQASHTIHFNHLFVYGREGIQSVALDVGVSVWERDDLKIKAVSVHYPQVFFITHDGKYGALEFSTGKTVWIKSRFFEDVLLVGQSGYVAFLTAKHLRIVNAITGVLKKKIELPKLGLAFETAWNRGLVLGDDRHFYVLNLASFSLKKQRKPKGEFLGWIQEKVAIMKDENIIKSQHIEFDRQGWSYEVSGNVTLKRAQDNLAIINDGKMSVINLISGEERVLKVAVSDNPFLSFWMQNRMLYVLQSDTVIRYPY